MSKENISSTTITPTTTTPTTNTPTTTTPTTKEILSLSTIIADDFKNDLINIRQFKLKQLEESGINHQMALDLKISIGLTIHLGENEIKKKIQYKETNDYFFITGIKNEDMKIMNQVLEYMSFNPISDHYKKCMMKLFKTDDLKIYFHFINKNIGNQLLFGELFLLREGFIIEYDIRICNDF